MNKLFNIISFNRVSLYSSILSICCIILLSGCKDVNPITPDGLVEVKFGTGIEVLNKVKGSTSTKTTPDGDEWISGDAVGIFMVSENGSIPSDILTVNYLKVDNIEYTVTPDGNDASSGTLTAVEPGNKIYYPQDGSEVDFISYYPYTFFPPTDSHIYSVFLGDQNNTEYIDILWGKSSGYSKGSATDRVTIEMNHVLSKVTFNLKAGDGVEDELTDAMIIIKGLPEYADIDLNDGSIDDIGELVEIYPKDIITTDGYDSSYQVITTPITSPYSQGVAIMVTLTSGEIYELKIPEGHSFTAGMSHNYGLKISALGLTLENHSINKWTVTEIRDNGGFSKPGIRTAEELVQFSNDWNATGMIDDYIERVLAQEEVIKKWSDNGQADGTIFLKADINMIDIPDFKPIGSFNETEWFDYGFTGKFDGNGYIINNLTINVDKYAGLFGYISGGEISNILIKNCSITAGLFAGGIAGGNDQSTITGCSMTDGTVTATDNSVGGIVGWNDEGAIIRCEVDGVTIMATNDHAGGIVGYTTGESVRIENCTVSGTSEIKANSSAGGIVGFNYQNTITGCQMTGGMVTATAENAGGIAGHNYQGTIIGCEMTGGTVTVTYYYAGGIVGDNFKGTITSCSTTDGMVTARYSNAGGIAGQNSGTNAKIENCTISGATEINANYRAGGIMGWNEGTITGCKMTGGMVTATEENAGGIAGYSGGESARIENCTVSGNSEIEADSFAGGIAGYNSSTITGCSMIDGIITTTGNYAGGIAGYNFVTIEGCTVSGISEIKANNFVGGITGENQGSVTGCLMKDGIVTTTDGCAGGIAGYNNGSIISCISAPETIFSSGDKGIIAGRNYSTSETCFWSATIDVTDAIGEGNPMNNGGEFDKADVKETDNFFSTNFEATGKTPIELMNEVLEAISSSWRWKAGNAASGWYPISFNTSN